MPEYTSPNIELDSANNQNARLLRASASVKSPAAGNPLDAPGDTSGSSSSNCELRSLGPLRTASQASGVKTRSSAQPTADQATRHPNATTAPPTLGNAAMNPTPTSSE